MAGYPLMDSSGNGRAVSLGKRLGAATCGMEFRLSLLLAGLVFIAYLNSFPGAFHFDDYPWLLENPLVRGPSFPYVAFLQHYGGRPLTFWSFYWNHKLFGEDAFSYHLISVALHSVSVVCVFLLALRFTRRRFQAFGAALIFALHPLQSQAVNYIWSRSVVLMSCFGLLSLLLARKRPLAALICWQLAMWSRSEAVMLAVFLWWIRPDLRKWAVGLALLNTAAFFCGLLVFRPGDFAWNHPDPKGYLLQQGNVFWQYVALVVRPAGLTVDHDFTPQPRWLALAGILALLAVSCCAYRLRSRAPVPVAGWFWFVALMTPSLVVPNLDVVNESRSYLALAGLALVFVWFLDRIQSGRRAALIQTVVLCTVAAGMLGLTRQRNQIWKDDVALWQDAVLKAGTKWRTHYNLGAALSRRGNSAEAEVEFQNARRLNAGDDFSAAGLGYCAELRRDWETSRRFYLEALKLNGSNQYARQRLAALQ